MKNYRISLIVPVYNKKEYLSKSLDSMVKQSYQSLEVILVDDGSTDGSSELCDQYALKYQFVKVLHKENGGPSSAWKYGFNNCSGEYIAFADSDDWIDIDMIEKMSDCLTGSRSEMIISDHVLEYSDGRRVEVYQPLSPGEYVGDQIREQIIPNLLGHEHRLITLSRCMKLISRDLIKNNIAYCDEKILMGDDSTIILPCIMDADRIFNMDHEAMYHYLYVEDSVVHRYDPHMFENNKLLYKNYISTINSKYDEGSSLRSSLLSGADAEYIFLLLLVIKNEARGNTKNCANVIKKICSEPIIRELVDRTPVEIKDKANCLLYMVLKKPTTINILLLRLAIKIYYSRR